MIGLLVTHIRFLSFLLRARLGAKDRIDCKDWTVLKFWKSKLISRNSYIAIFKVVRGCILLTLHFEFTLELRNFSCQLSEFVCETSVVEGASKALSNCLSYLGIPILLWLLIISGLVLNWASFYCWTIFSDSFSDILLILLLFMRHNFLSQARRQITSLRVLVQHFGESVLHLSFNVKSLALDVLHLLFNCGNAFLQDGRI